MKAFLCKWRQLFEELWSQPERKWESNKQNLQNKRKETHTHYAQGKMGVQSVNERTKALSDIEKLEKQCHEIRETYHWQYKAIIVIDMLAN